MKVIQTKRKGKTRYVIVDDNGKLVDDAQGYGYKSVQKAKASTQWNKPKKAEIKVQRKISRATKETKITVIRSESLSTDWQDRYVIIDRFSRKVVDNANGRGYRTRVAAYSAWTWIKRKVRGEL